MNSPFRREASIVPVGRSLFAFLLLGVAPLFVGCDPPQAPATRGAAQTANAAKEDHLVRVFDLLKQREELGDDRQVPELIYHLNHWQDSQDFPEDWKPDPLVDRLPRSLKQFITPDILKQAQFDFPDVAFLREALLLRELSRWAGRQPTDAALERWIREESGLNEPDRDSLATAARLFDWTVRNVQLDELLPYPKDEAEGPTGAPSNLGPGIEMPAPLRAAPGPGYQHEPLQIMLGGRGDAIERMRLFVLLARQHQIDAVVLAVYDLKVSPRPLPWAAAVVLSDRLYLFDPALGLPLPSVGGAGVATLEEVRKTENYFERLRGDEKSRYPFGPSDMGNLVALVEASPLSLTRRMQALEGALVGQQQLLLTARPSALADRVRKIPGVNNAGILPASWEAPLYRAAIQQMAKVNPQAATAVLAEEALFREATPVGEGRWRYLQGRFENEDREKGAKALYLSARLPEAILDRLRSDVGAQKMAAFIRPAGMSDEAWQARVVAGEFLLRQAKMHATYWLGLVHLETQHPDVAVEWFKSRTMEADPPSRWKNGARYNLARCYEQMGKFAEARELYRDDDSPQRLGNLLRARRLAGLPNAASATDGQSQDAPKGTGSPKETESPKESEAPKPSEAPKDDAGAAKDSDAD